MDVKVSVITVCYNSEATIRKTIESVLQQSYELIEYIVVDGGSTDATMDIVMEYMPQFDDRIKVISEPDQGIYDAMNKGIHMATGELISILNSDDFFERFAVEQMVNALGQEKYQILYGFVRTIREDGMEITVERQSHNMLRERMIGHPACFVTKTVYEDFGVYDLQYESVADYDFMLRMQKIPEVIFKPVDHIITNFTLGGMSASNKAWLDLLKLKKNHGMISQKEYKKEMFKNKIYGLIKRG